MAALAATAGPVCISNNRRLNAQRTACNTLSCRTRAAAVDRPSTDKRHVLQLNPADIQPVQCLKEWAVTCAALGAGQQTVSLLYVGGAYQQRLEHTQTAYSNRGRQHSVVTHHCCYCLLAGVDILT
jgi:hypothetical protein